MESVQQNEAGGALPADSAKPARRALANAGYSRLEELAKHFETFHVVT